MSDPKYFQDLGENYSGWPGSRYAGLMTFRYLKLFCTYAGENTPLNNLETIKQAFDFEQKYFFPDYIIKLELTGRLSRKSPL